MFRDEELSSFFREIFSPEEVKGFLDIVERFSPIPRATLEALRGLISNHRERKKEIVDLVRDERALMVISRVLGYSIYLRSIVNERVDLLFELCRDLVFPFDSERVKREIDEILEASGGDKGFFLRNLRDVRKREFLRIVSRELVGFSSFEETCGDLSVLADMVIDGVFRFNFLELSGELGIPSSEFCIISLGKLGGMEINYSSDVDIIFVYEKDGKTSKGIENVEFFDKLARNIIYDLSSSVEGEFLYRVDTRLRPDGEFGALVREEKSYYEYYAERAQAWELQMLVKARYSAGDQNLGQRFVSNVREIIFSTPFTDAEIGEILGVKQKIKGAEYDLKKSTGGIRDIEFIVQLLQLIFGTRERSLRVQNTLQALERLEKLKVLDKDTKRVLEYGYRTLRRLENYVQLYANLQDFSLPVGNRDRMVGLSRLLQFRDSKVLGDEEERLLQIVSEVKREVIRVKGYIFEKLLDVRVGEEGIFFLYNSDEKEVRDLLISYGIRETTRAFSFLESMISSSFRGGVETSIGLRNLLRAISNSPFPDRSLSNVYYVLEATQNLPISIQFFTDERNVNFMFNVSLLKDTLINILRRRNWIWDGMMDTNAFMDYLPTFFSRISFSGKDYLERIREVYEVTLTSLAFLRINRFISSNRTKKLFSEMYDRIFEEFSRNLGGEVCVLALGRWASRKLTFFSDIDLIYILPFDPASSEFFELRDRVIRYHNELNTIFEIDTRLVEGAHKGSFVVSLRTLEEKPFDIWQVVAYLKSRPVSSNERFAKTVRDLLASKLSYAIRKLDLEEFSEYAKRVISTFERTNDFKKGRGNLLELELILDKLYFKHFVELGELLIASSLSEMSRALEKVVRFSIPIRDYISFIVELEEVSRIVEGNGFDERIFGILGMPVSYEEFRELRDRVITWCDEVIRL